MSDNNRELFGKEKRPQNELLDELDSLKDLLDEENEEEVITAAPWEFTPTEASPPTRTAPTLDRTIEITPPLGNASAHESTSEESQLEIPVLEEVLLDGDEVQGGIPELVEVVDTVNAGEPALPDSAELLQLVELLVERRLADLKASLTEQVMAELTHYYPSLRQR